MSAPGGGGVDVGRVLDDLTAAAAPLRATRWQHRVKALGRIGERFLDASDPLRRRALQRLPDDAGVSPAQAAWIVEGMARDWTEPRLDRLVRTEFETPDALDRWVDDPRAPEGRRVRAFPLTPGPAVHICAGSVPGVSVTSMIRGLLVGAPVLLKPGAGDEVLPGLFLEALRGQGDVETSARALADAAAVVYWPGGAGGRVEQTVLDRAGHVVVYGGSSTIATLRRRLAPTTPLVEYGHRLSLAVLGPGADGEAGRTLAAAVAAFDQRGCVCPHQVFVIGDTTAARMVAEGLAEALSGLAEDVPAGRLDPGRASAVQQVRGAAAVRRAAGEGVGVWEGSGVEWTVILDPDQVLRPSCLGRTVHVTPIADAEALDRVLEPAGPFLQTVGIDGFDESDGEAVAERVCRLGASRVVPVARMAFPPAWWIHDGQGPLRRLVRWGAAGPA